jgi:thiol-disulfide isomerase/thioredoxin
MLLLRFNEDRLWTFESVASYECGVYFEGSLCFFLPPTTLSPSTMHVEWRGGTNAPREYFLNKVVALYFGAHWCGPCRRFATQLKARKYNSTKYM